MLTGNMPVIFVEVHCGICQKSLGYMPQARTIEYERYTEPVLYCSMECALRQYEECGKLYERREKQKNVSSTGS